MKTQFQDITPSRRSIRDIPLKGERIQKSVPQPPLPPPPPTFSKRDTRPKRSFGWIITITVLILFSLFGFSYFFARATIKVSPKIAVTNVDQTFSADQKPKTDSVLPYALITLEKDGSAEVPGTGEKKVSTKASGQIIIYNNYSTEEQDLIATTRFQTPEGLVYRIDKNITVPGKTASVPGSVEATVYADEAGEKYNVGLKDFTIPGFKGTPKYELFYARSKIAITGGFVGTQKQASADDVARAHNKIEGELGRKLLEEARGQKPDNFILFDGAILTEFSELPNGSSSANMVTIREKVTAKAIVFDRQILSSFLIKSMGGDETTTSVKELDNLSFKLLNKDATLTGSSTAINFNLKGSVKLVSVIDNVKLSADLAGIKRGDFNKVLATYPGVNKAQVVFQPPWLLSFPKSPAKIKIEVLDE